MPPPRLSAVDASFLYLEQPRTPMHVGAVGIFRAPAGGFDYERLVETVERRLVAVPRYRQKVRHVPGELARPVWVDDADFDVAFHVRRSALPRPGHARPAHRAGGPADVAAARPRPPAVGGLPRRGARRRPRSRSSRRPTRRWSTASRRSTSGRCCSTRRPSRARCPTSCGCRGPSRRDVRLVVDAVAEAIARPGQVVDIVRATANDALAVAARLRARGRRAGRHGRDRRPAGAGIPAQRRRSPPSAGSPSPAATSPRTGRCAPRTGAR